MPKRPHSEIDSRDTTHHPSSTIRICVGSYEHILYGINADISTCSGSNDQLAVTFNPVYMFEAHTAQIKTCAIGGRYLASGGVDEVLKLYDLRKRRDLGNLLSHDGTITSIKFPPTTTAEQQQQQPTHMLSADENNKLIIWRIKDWTPQVQLTTRHGKVNDLSIHPSGKICLTVGIDRQVRLWNLVTGKKAAAYKLGKEEPLAVAWNQAGNGYAILFSRYIGIYDMSAALKHKFEAPQRNKFHALAWFTPTTASAAEDDEEKEKEEESRDELLIGTLDDGTVQIMNPKSGQVQQVLKGHKTRVKAVSSQAVFVPKLAAASSSSNGTTTVQSSIIVIVTGSTDGELKLWAPSKSTGAVRYVEIGSYSCGQSRITTIATCDANVEDLEAVVKRRVEIKQEVLSEEEEDAVKSEDSDEGEEFSGFD